MTRPSAPDLPQVWNQKQREALYLHWDGNINTIHERNDAAMAVGATPESALPPIFNRVTNWLLGRKPPAWPWTLDQANVAQGKPIWDSNCAGCHDLGRADTGQVTTNIDQLGTDPHRLEDVDMVGWPMGTHGSFTLNSNHEMYSSAHGYFKELAKRFPGQQGTSYFALYNDDWLVVGLDSAYASDALNL